MSFTMRTKCPDNNKYYIRKVNGGYNGAIQGKPTKKGANVLSNCVGYANGRFNEIINKGKCKYQFVCNAENFIEKAQDYGLKVSPKPTLGGIMVWQKGSLSSSDGAGHVAIVEKVIDSNTIYTSESNYGGAAFYNSTRNNNNGKWGIGKSYKFRGCIVNPEVKEPIYTKGIYKCNYDMNIRVKPYGTIKKVKDCTVEMQKALVSKKPNDNAVVKKGTNFTALDIVKDGNSYWAINYSGYICIDDGSTKYCTKI